MHCLSLLKYLKINIYENINIGTCIIVASSYSCPVKNKNTIGIK